ncbi:MAG: hypothetical protein SWQ30_21550 [Thermodesulfobacteriota bacterium]|nr:hypothetical protein [Thermodesulfobacteriota bacterium]
MSLKQWAANSWLRPHTSSPQEIGDLLFIVDRDLVDAGQGISSDWQFGIAYNAALKLCTILLYASGYRAERSLQHYRTIQALPIILGDKWAEDAEYLETCRKKRNIVEYEYVGGATETDVEELISFVEDLRKDVMDWLRKNHPSLLSVFQGEKD